MRVAIVLNQRKSDDMTEFEFASPDIVNALTTALRSEHDIEVIDCDRNIDRWVGRLRKFAPDVVFNNAEGFAGAAREAVYAGIYEQLGLPYTGSDPTALLITHNKQLTKQIVSSAGLRCARSRVLGPSDSLEEAEEWVGYPAIVKPNSEGSSIGIEANTIVRDRARLEERCAYLWRKWRALAMVEEFIADGRDISMTYIEGLGPEIFGPLWYDYSGTDILDATTKNMRHEPSILKLDHGLDSHAVSYLTKAMRTAVRVLDVTGYGRADFRVGPGGECWFIEMNGQPVFQDERADFLDPVMTAGHSYREIICHIVRLAVKKPRFPATSGLVPL